MASTISAGTTSGTALNMAGDTTGILQLQTNGTTTAVTIDASQNVGIGTSSPTTRLQVTNASGSGTGIVNTLRLQHLGTSADDGAKILFTAGSSTDGAGIGSGGKALNSANLLFYTGGANERMRIDQDGNVGIGTSSPATKLEVAGSVSTQQTQGRYFGFGTGGFSFDGTTVNDYGITYTTISSTFNTVVAGYSNIKFATSQTERMRIDSSGNLLVGTTDSGFGSKVVVKTAASFTNTNYRSDSVTATGTGWNHFYGTSNSNSVANIIIYGNGNIQNANNSYGSLSDSKLKENIVDATPKLDKLMQVKIRNYNLKGDYEQFKQIGVVAQELETVFPSLVEEFVDKDAENNDLGTTTKSVKYSVFVPMLIKAMQEQQVMIENLTTRLTALENK